ncbi:MAG: transposase [Deltaproteobacteria bacterium]|nr:transposase [Deltaproteobacteria bacterium]
MRIARLIDADELYEDLSNSTSRAYLARYLKGGPISNSRIIRVTDNNVTFKDSGINHIHSDLVSELPG